MVLIIDVGIVLLIMSFWPEEGNFGWTALLELLRATFNAPSDALVAWIEKRSNKLYYWLLIVIAGLVLCWGRGWFPGLDLTSFIPSREWFH